MDIQELFARDPLALSDTDLTTLIEKFRAARGQFNMGNMKAGTTKAPTAKQAKTAEIATKLNFDLDL